MFLNKKFILLILKNIREEERFSLFLFVPVFIVVGFCIAIVFTQDVFSTNKINSTNYNSLCKSLPLEQNNNTFCKTVNAIYLKFLTNKQNIYIFTVFSIAVCVVAFVVNWIYFFVYLGSFAIGIVIWIFIQEPQTSKFQILSYHKNLIITCGVNDISYKASSKSIICTDLKISSNKQSSDEFFSQVKKIKLSLKTDQAIEQDFDIGDVIKVRADLFSMPQKSYPFSYNYEGQMIYSGFNAMGVAREVLQIDHFDNKSFLQGVNKFFKTLRNKISFNISQNVEDNDVSSIINALVTGQRGEISQQINREVSLSGLVHILSISGLHVAIIAGFFMFITRIILVLLLKNFILHINPRKIQVIVAVVGSFCYIALSGFLIPALRSFIMIFLILMAVLVQKKAITIRTVIIASCLIFLIYPYAVFFASFQLSFAAIICLVLGVGYVNNKFSLSKHSVINKYILGIVISSIFIGFSSFYLVVYHFSQFSVSSIFANIVAIPLVSFVIMPLCVLYIIFWICGFYWIYIVCLKLLNYSVLLLLLIAKVFSSSSWFYISMVGPSDGLFYSSCFCLLWFAFYKSKIRYLGLLGVFIISVLYFFEVKSTKNLAVSNGYGVVLLNNNNNYSIKENKYLNDFTKQVWLQELGLKHNPSKIYKTNYKNKDNIYIISDIKSLEWSLCDSSAIYIFLNNIKAGEILKKYNECSKTAGTYTKKSDEYINTARTKQIIFEESLLNNDKFSDEFRDWLKLENNLFCYLDFKFYGTHIFFSQHENNFVKKFVKKTYE
jgi:ComEC/Rec2-related protein